MRFLFVDHIDTIAAREISGRVRFHALSPLRCRDAVGDEVLAPGVIGEAMGQLVSWLLMSQQDFQFRPVYLFSERLEIVRGVSPGHEVHLKGTVHSVDAQSVVFSGEATVDGVVVQRLRNCSNYFLPLATVEDPEATRDAFARLRSVGGMPLLDQGPAYDFGKLIVAVSDLQPGRTMTADCVVPETETFYRDHFPRQPITPVVIINEIINRATQSLLIAGADPTAAFLPRAVAEVKIKSFIRPGEPFQVKVDLQPEAAEEGGLRRTVTQVIKNGKPILRGKYLFERAVAPAPIASGVSP